jgi:hypothetical protein
MAAGFSKPGYRVGLILPIRRLCVLCASLRASRLEILDRLGGPKKTLTAKNAKKSRKGREEIKLEN